VAREMTEHVRSLAVRAHELLEVVDINDREMQPHPHLTTWRAVAQDEAP
jgi:hypothetical protein